MGERAEDIKKLIADLRERMTSWSKHRGLITETYREPDELCQRAADALETIYGPPRPLDEWHEDYGSVLWWKFPIEEPPYVGTPNDLGQTVEVSIRAYGVDEVMRTNVGAWPGYHTHWTRIPLPPEPALSTKESEQ